LNFWIAKLDAELSKARYRHNLRCERSSLPYIASVGAIPRSRRRKGPDTINKWHEIVCDTGLQLKSTSVMM